MHTPPHCPVCNGSNCTKLGEARRRPIPTVAGVPIDVSDLQQGYWRCRDCTYEFIYPPTPDERLLDCYARAEVGHWVTDHRTAELRNYQHKRDLLTRLAPGRRILDFGCFDGGFLEYLGDSFERAGIEPSAAAAQTAASKGIRMLGANLSALGPAAGTFDAILMFDVIEHLNDPVATLRHLGQALSRGGIILIETGNTDTPSWRRRGPLYSYAALVEHVGFFNRKSIGVAAGRAGLSLEVFEESIHSYVSPVTLLQWRLQNGVYWLLRFLWTIGLPLPRAAGAIAMGPMVRLSEARNHFLAVLGRTDCARASTLLRR